MYDDILALFVCCMLLLLLFYLLLFSMCWFGFLPLQANCHAVHITSLSDTIAAVRAETWMPTA
jgi:hypothetical protein